MTIQPNLHYNITKTNLTGKQTRERIFPLSTYFSSLPSLHLHKNYHFGEKFKMLCRRKQCCVTFITNYNMMKSDCGEKAVKDKQTGKTYLLKFKYLYSKSKTQNFPSISHSHIFSFASTHKFSDCFIFSSLLKNPATGNNREADHTIAAR
jgi:hypothetical protein